MRQLEDLKLSAELEQADAAFSNAALLLGNYYQSLIEAGIPPHLADDLVIRQQVLLFTRKKGTDAD